jgi:hypothetical protein
MKLGSLLAHRTRLRVPSLRPMPSRFTAGEVRALLAAPASDSSGRRAAVLAVAAAPGAWVHRARPRDAEVAAWLAQRLPTVVYLYATGISTDELGRRLGGRGAWAVEQALNVACAAIADRLNENPNER